MTIMTLADFRADHGDPVGWSVADHDEYTVLSELSPPARLAAELAAQAAGGGR
ncbi:hypothetical protein [Streptomyces sp. NPDC051567]|uniref:hypothetical protein n=1 Tax=Streptomyces sp. NPDC051567 TaxID=3365660 RepID=UPI0037A3E657